MLTYWHSCIPYLQVGTIRFSILRGKWFLTQKFIIMQLAEISTEFKVKIVLLAGQDVELGYEEKLQ